MAVKKYIIPLVVLTVLSSYVSFYVAHEMFRGDLSPKVPVADTGATRLVVRQSVSEQDGGDHKESVNQEDQLPEYQIATTERNETQADESLDRLESNDRSAEAKEARQQEAQDEVDDMTNSTKSLDAVRSKDRRAEEKAAHGEADAKTSPTMSLGADKSTEYKEPEHQEILSEKADDTSSVKAQDDSKRKNLDDGESRAQNDQPADSQSDEPHKAKKLDKSESEHQHIAEETPKQNKTSDHKSDLAKLQVKWEGDVKRLEPHRDDGRYVKVTDGEYAIYVFNAYWDDRPLLDSGPVIRILGYVVAQNLSWEVLESQIQCAVSCHGNPSWDVAPLYSHHRVTKQEFIKGRTFDRHLLSCKAGACAEEPGPKVLRVFFAPNSTAASRRLNVSVGLSSAEDILVRHPRKDGPSIKLGTCRPSVFKTLDPYQLVAWLEIQKLLGVEKVVLYNDSVDAITSTIARHYERQGLVDIWQMKTDIFIDDGVDSPTFRQPLTTTDCMYRYMFAFDRIMCIDSDEIIIPRAVETLPELIEVIDRNETLYNGTYNLRVDYQFIGGYFILDDISGNPDVTQPRFLSMLRYRNRRPLTRRYRKSIFNPRGCITARNHYCSNQIPFYKDNRPALNIAIRSSVAYVHHYRPQLQFTADYESEPDVTDNIIMRYADRLLPNVEKQLRLLKLYPDPT